MYNPSIMEELLILRLLGVMYLRKNAEKHNKKLSNFMRASYLRLHQNYLPLKKG